MTDIRPIGVLRSCFGQKFGIPRQAGLVPAAEAVLELDPTRVTPDAVRGLDAFSHVWIVFVFHAAEGVKMVVRPPRLGGGRKVGVLATRAPHRPNNIGLSAVRLLGVEGLSVRLGGGDFLDGTPVLDVKPYLPYADALPDATAGWAGGALPRVPVRVAAEVTLPPDLLEVVVQSLSLDPRRAGARGGSYAMRVGPFDVHAVYADGAWEVVRVVEV